MLCPECREPQVIVEFEGIELDVCIDGHGTWFDAQELALLLESAGLSPEERELEKGLVPVDDPALGPKRRCPRCATRMEHVRAPAEPEPVILDRCRRGHGLWFDPGELRQVVASRVTADHPVLAKIREHLCLFDQPPAAQPPAKEKP